MLKDKMAMIPMQKTLLVPYKKPVFFNKKTKYVAKIGCIIYAMVEIQIDIVFATSMLSCFVKNAEPDNFSVVN